MMRTGPGWDVQGGPRLAPGPRGGIAHDTGLPRGAASAAGFSRGHDVSSLEEVGAAAPTPAGRRRAGVRGNILTA